MSVATHELATHELAIATTPSTNREGKRALYTRNCSSKCMPTFIIAGQSNALGMGLGFYLFVYTLLSIISAASVVYRNLVVRFGLMENGDNVHFKMVNNILRSKLSWFETNPAARIVYR